MSTLSANFLTNLLKVIYQPSCNDHIRRSGQDFLLLSAFIVTISEVWLLYSKWVRFGDSLKPSPEKKEFFYLQCLVNFDVNACTSRIQSLSKLLENSWNPNGNADS